MPQRIEIPTWEQADDIKNSPKETPIHRFVYNYQPAHDVEIIRWRQLLQELVDFIKFNK